MFDVTRTYVVIRFILSRIVLYENGDEQQTKQHLFFFKEKKKRRRRKKEEGEKNEEHKAEIESFLFLLSG